MSALGTLWGLLLGGVQEVTRPMLRARTRLEGWTHGAANLQLYGGKVEVWILQMPENLRKNRVECLRSGQDL